MSKVPAPPDDPATRLVSRLNAVRAESGGLTARQRRVTLARELELQLAEVPAAERHAVLQRALGTIRPSASGPSPPGTGEASAVVTKLRAELELVRSEKEALAKELDSLSLTRDALLRENAKMRAEQQSKLAPAVAGGSIEVFRQGLKEALAGKRVDPAALGLPPGEIRLFRLTHELVNFIHMLERGRLEFLSDVADGPGRGGTVIIKAGQAQVRKQLLAVLNDEEGSIRAVRRTLDAQNRFILGVPNAFQGAIPLAVKALLEQLDPEPMLASSKKFMTDQYKDAWAVFVRTRNDLSNLAEDEIWQAFFRQAFQEKLDDWTKTEG